MAEAPPKADPSSAHHVAPATPSPVQRRPVPSPSHLPPPPPLARPLAPALSPIPTPSPADPPPRRSGSTNPLIKGTLVGIQPTPLAKLVPPQAPPPPGAPSSGSDELSAGRREPPTVDTAPRGRADEPLADVPGAPDAPEPEVFLPALLEPTIGQRLRLAVEWTSKRAAVLWTRVRVWTVTRAWPWLVARARDRAPRARAAFGGAVLGGVLLVAVCARLCAGGHESNPDLAVASASAMPTIAPTVSAVPSAEAKVPTATPSASAPVELGDDVPSPTPSGPPAGVFTRARANAALETARGDLTECKSLGAVRGPGSVRATFSKDGAVARITIGPPYADTPEGACILDRLGRARVAPFRGPPGAVNYAFNIPR